MSKFDSTKNDQPFAGIRSLIVILSSSFHADPVRTVLALILYPLAYLEGPLIAYGLLLATDGAIAGEQTSLFVGAGLIVSAMSLLHIADHTAWQLALRLEDRVGFALDKRIMKLVSSVTGIEHFERPAYLDRLEILRESGWMLGRSMYVLPMNVADVLRAGVTFYLLANVHPALLLLVVFAIPSIILDLRSDNRVRIVEEQCAEGLRKARHYYELSTSHTAGKELRIFGLCKEIFSRHRNTWADIHNRQMNAKRSEVGWATLGWLIFAAGFVLSLGLVTWRVVRGEATIGELVLTFTLAARVNRESQVGIELIGWTRRVARIARHLLWLEKYAHVPRIDPPAFEAVPQRLKEGISLKGISFRYPDTDSLVLKNINIDLPAGSTVALVGENGAGKSSLVKLLCRFYDPTEGIIAVDGIELNRFNMAEWRDVCSASFQDFFRFELYAREAVGIGDLPNLDNSKAVNRAVDSADAQDVVQQLKSGLDTQLGSRWNGGQELSAGQWQKMALARTLMRRSPLLLILDEPTANLDPKTEHELFLRQAAAAKESTNGAVSLIVSHRFSTVAMADTIIVISDGEIAERGSHDELVGSDGLYADLYSIQATAYRREENE